MMRDPLGWPFLLGLLRSARRTRRNVTYCTTRTLVDVDGFLVWIWHHAPAPPGTPSPVPGD
jgi:hypothetical protein